MVNLDLSKLTIDSTSDTHQLIITFLVNLYFLLVQYLGLLILIIFLLQDFCQHIWIPKTKESFWATCRTFIGMTLTYSNIVLINYTCTTTVTCNVMLNKLKEKSHCVHKKKTPQSTIFYWTFHTDGCYPY